MNNFFKALITLIVITISSVNVFADSVDLGEYVPSNNIVINGIDYLLYDDSKEAYVISADKNLQGKVIIPSYVTKKGVNYKVTKICSSVFFTCYGITSIILPDTLEEIESGAFTSCKNLVEVKMPKTLKKMGDCFDCCHKLERITLPEGIEDIENRTFYGCSSLKNIIIPNSVKRIRDNAFLVCRSLEEVRLLNPYTRINEHAFDGCTKGVNIINWYGRTCKPRLEYKYLTIDGMRTSMGIQIENPDED